MNDMTFHAKLILDNDQDCASAVECLTTHVMNKIYYNRHGRAFEDQNRVRVYILSQFVRAYVEELTDAEGEHGFNNQMTNELICGAIQEINFREISEDLIRDYTPKGPAEVAEDEEFFNLMGFCNYDIDEDMI